MPLLVAVIGMTRYARVLPNGLLPEILVCDACGSPSRPLYFFPETGAFRCLFCPAPSRARPA